MPDCKHRFQVGDEVRLVVGTAAWAEHPLLHDVTGRVVRQVDDGAPVKRVDVEFNGKLQILGAPEGIYAPA